MRTIDSTNAGYTAPPLDAAREALLQARRLLREPSPRNIALCRVSLAAAAERTESLAAGLRQSNPHDRGLLGAAIVLREEIRAIAALLESAASFHARLPHASPVEAVRPAPRRGIRLRP